MTHETTMGTRVIIRADGSWIQLVKLDDGLPLLTVVDEGQHRVDLRLTQRECLALIEYLAVAATPGSEGQVVEVIDDRATNTVATVCLGDGS